MKANELQIGDYVNYRGQIIKVTSLYDKGGSNEVGWSNKESVWVNASNVEPIPLTPEILEKNGFVNDRGIYCWRDENKQITYFSKENNRPYCTYSFVNIESGCIDVNELPMEYVHELQHTLRLCGIKIEIEL